MLHHSAAFSMLTTQCVLNAHEGISDLDLLLSLLSAYV